MRSGVMRISFRPFCPWRITSWAAAKGMRCVKPSMATLLPSRRLSAIASWRERNSAITLSRSSSLQFVAQNFPRPAHRGVAGWNAGIDRGLSNECGELGDGDAIAQRRAHVELEFFFAVQRDHHCEREQGAGLVGQRRVAPDFVPGKARD